MNSGKSYGTILASVTLGTRENERKSRHTLGFKRLVAFVHDAQRWIGLERFGPLLDERQGPLPNFLVRILPHPESSVYHSLALGIDARQTYPIGNKLLHPLRETPRRKLAMQLNSAVLLQRLGKGERKELYIGRPMRQSFQDRCDDISGSVSIVVESESVTTKI